MRLVAVTTVLIFLAACSDVVDERYGTWEDAEKAGAIERGWVPKFVPTTASNIRSMHDLDLNANRLTFELDPEAIDSMIDSIAPLSELRGGMVDRAYEKAGWRRQKTINESAYLMCTQTYSGALVIDKQRGRVAYLEPAEWGREFCPRPL